MKNVMKRNLSIMKFSTLKENLLTFYLKKGIIIVIHRI